MEFANPLYGPKPVSRVRIPPSPPVFFTPGFSYLRQDSSSCFELIHRCHPVRKAVSHCSYGCGFTVLQADLT